ncbi:dTDP-4-dehydrorhamnose reductase [Terricaulis sp.]|uniref:dTDP-4-dehydrorhamnose reductase n=1 Tax=Terricaulis sp. TaxID=2768686 RepID=UPI0037839FCF
MKVLVIGRGGQVARALVRRAPEGVAVETLSRPELDLAALRDADALVAVRRPDVVINAAAYTAVDAAESDADAARAVNAQGAEAVAAAAARLGAPVIQVSTDYVFAGDKGAPYVESDPVGPTGVYGRTKLEGERLVAAANSSAVIVRTAWVYDAHGKNFVRTMLRLAGQRPELSVVSDQQGCPTFADDLADALFAIARAPKPGVVHCAGAGETTWAGFAEAIMALAAERGGPSAKVQPIPTSAYPTPAKRPANSRLNCAKLQGEYGVAMRPWRAALADCVDEIAAGGWRVG